MKWYDSYAVSSVINCRMLCKLMSWKFGWYLHTEYTYTYIKKFCLLLCKNNARNEWILSKFLNIILAFLQIFSLL